MLRASPHPCLELFENEIKRFHEYSQLRSTIDEYTFRRSYKRHHRSWPLLIASVADNCLQEYSAALHDASPEGIGFICEQHFPVDSLIYIKLFWHDATALPVPAIVRHVSPAPAGLLVGAEYALSDYSACESALTMR